MYPTFRKGAVHQVIPLVVTLLLLGGCDSSSTGPDDPGAGNATLSVWLTDAPGDVANVWVEVENVILVGNGGQVSLLDEATELINLMELRDSTLPLVTDADVEVGTYGQVRFIIGGAVLETTDGQVFVRGGAQHPNGLAATGNLMCPSCSQTGIKVRIPSDVEMEAGSNGLLLDFDVTQSFGRQAGQSGMWVMQPTIQGVLAPPEEIEQGEFGMMIEGSVLLGLDLGDLPLVLPVCSGEQRTLVDFTPTATSTTLTDDDGEPLVFAGETTGSGSFSIRVLHADTYSLGFRGETVLDAGTIAWTAGSVPGQVTVTDGVGVEGVVFTVVGASCTTP
jgi:hypothetical protein